MNIEAESIPIFRSSLPHFEKYSGYLERMYETGIFTNNGPLIKELETRFAEYLEVDAANVVLCANATLGLQGALMMCKSRRILVPSYTFAATAHAALMAEKEIELVDVDPVHWQLDVTEPSTFGGSLEDCGILGVLPFGKAHIPDAWTAYDEVVLDAATTIGNPELRLSELPLGWSAVFSLHATKVMGIGEGGLAYFSNAERAERFRAWINFGFSSARSSEFIATNAKLTEFAAAVGLAVLDQWPIERREWNELRTKARGVEESLGLTSFLADMNTPSPYWIIELPNQINKTEWVQAFEKANIATRDWWGDGLHRMPAFSQYGRNFPVTDRISRHTVGLPFYRTMPDEAFERIREVFATVIS